MEPELESWLIRAINGQPHRGGRHSSGFSCFGDGEELQELLWNQCWGFMYDYYLEDVDIWDCVFSREFETYVDTPKKRRWVDEYYRFLLDPKRSPFRVVLEKNPPLRLSNGMMINDFNFFKERGFVVYNNSETPGQPLMMFLIACRAFYEARPHGTTIMSLLYDGLEPEIAFSLGSMLQRTTNPGHLGPELRGGEYRLATDYHGLPIATFEQFPLSIWANVINGEPGKSASHRSTNRIDPEDHDGLAEWFFTPKTEKEFGGYISKAKDLYDFWLTWDERVVPLFPEQPGGGVAGERMKFPASKDLFFYEPADGTTHDRRRIMSSVFAVEFLRAYYNKFKRR